MKKIVIIGSGPSGATAARLLADGGSDVTVIEGEKLPRHKPCGGGMPTAIAAHLLLDELTHIVDRTVSNIHHTFNFSDSLTCKINQIDDEKDFNLIMVQRPTFDNALMTDAIKKGAKLIDCAWAKKITEANDKIIVTFERNGETQAIEADYLIGADGANGVSCRALGLSSQRHRAVAIEIEREHDWLTEGNGLLRSDTVFLDYGVVQNGYAWIFPKDNHINVGAGIFYHNKNRHGQKSSRAILHDAVRKYLKYVGLSEDISKDTVFAHTLPMWAGQERFSSTSSRILLVGDAAGLVNPLFGDGIFNGIKSAEIAAQAILSDETKQFDQLIKTEFAKDLTSAARFAKGFMTAPKFFYKFAVKQPNATRAAMRLLAGDLKFEGLQKRVFKRLGRAIPRKLFGIASKG